MGECRYELSKTQVPFLSLFGGLMEASSAKVISGIIEDLVDSQPAKFSHFN